MTYTTPETPNTKLTPKFRLGDVVEYTRASGLVISGKFLRLEHDYQVYAQFSGPRGRPTWAPLAECRLSGNVYDLDPIS